MIRKLATTCTAAVLVAPLIFIAGTDRAGAATDDPNILSILAVGDSYTAGNGAGGYYGDAGCWRSDKNYAREFQRLIEATPGHQPVFVETRACSGAVTADFFSSRDGRPPMLDWVNPGYDVIFLTIGGNDVYFEEIVEHCLVKKRRKAIHCEENLSRAESLLGDGSVERSIRDVLKGIHDRAAPDAKIVLLGYPYLEGDALLQGREPFTMKGTGKDSGLVVQVGLRVRQLGADGDRIQQAVITELNTELGSDQFIYVPTKKLFAGDASWLPSPPISHELFADFNNKNRWMVQPSLDGSWASISTFYHPNPDGWHKEAELLFKDARVPKADAQAGDPDRDATASPFTLVPQDANSGRGIWPASDGWWLTAKSSSDTQWTYQWVSPTGGQYQFWDTTYDPISVVAGPGSTMYVAGLDRNGSDVVHLVKIGPTGVITDRTFTPDPRAPFIQKLALGVDGNLYWYAALSDGHWVQRVDSNTLDITSRRSFWADNAGMVAAPAGLTIANYAGSMAYIPYSAFTPELDGEPWTELVVPPTYSAQYRQISVGVDGSVADMSDGTRECDSVTTSHRTILGGQWTANLGSLVNAELTNCEAVDLDALSSGDVVYTLRSDGGLHLMWVSASGVRERLVPIGSGGLNITTTSSDSGEVFVTYTDLHECPVTDPPVPDGYKCSFVWLVGLRDGVEETTSQLFSGPREVLSPFVGFAGRPHIAIGKGQVLAEVYSSDPHACGSDNCIPYGVEFQYRTKLVTTAGVSRRESFTWY